MQSEGVRARGAPRARFRDEPSALRVVAGVFAVVGVVLAAATLAGPWWGYHIEYYFGFGYQDLHFGLFGYTSAQQSSGPLRLYAFDYDHKPNTAGMMLTVAILIAATLAIGALGAAFAFVGIWRHSRRWRFAFMLVGGVLALVAASYMMAVLPDVMAEFLEGHFGGRFWGVQDLGGAELTWGPNWAWYLLILAGICMLVGGVAGVVSNPPLPGVPERGV